MIIKKRKTKYLKLGDILIIDWLEIISKDIKISARGNSAGINKLKKKVEGESAIMLFEIDDIDKEYVDSAKQKGTRYTFYHIQQLFNNMASIQTELIDYEWTVIVNPHHTLKHYKDRVIIANKLNEAISSGNAKSADILREQLKPLTAF